MTAAGPSTPILMYHALWRASGDPAADRAAWERDPQLRDPGARLYALDDQTFDRQMEKIAQAGGGRDRAWEDLYSEKSAGKVWITFDDGHRSNHELALPILQRRGLTAAFFITTDWIGSDGFMTADQLRGLRDAGMLLGTHGKTHAYFSDLSPAALEEELAGSKARLEEILGEPVAALALPGGRNHPAIQETARRAGYMHLFTSRMAATSPASNPLDLPRIAVTQREDDLFFERLLADDFSQVEAMARGQRRRDLAKRLLGNGLYDRLRSLLIRG